MDELETCCLRYCKSTIFQANHNRLCYDAWQVWVVCDTAKVRFFKQITTSDVVIFWTMQLFAILQKYDFSSKSQHGNRRVGCVTCCLRYCKSTIFQANHNSALEVNPSNDVVCDTAKVRFFKQITTQLVPCADRNLLFAILQKYDFSSKSQPNQPRNFKLSSCLRYCKSTIFQANHNFLAYHFLPRWLFAILQKYDFSSKSQLIPALIAAGACCLRYCKSTIFQANHNGKHLSKPRGRVVCDTAKVRFFKQITTPSAMHTLVVMLFAILQKYDFSSKSQLSTIQLV